MQESRRQYISGATATKNTSQTGLGAELQNSSNLKKISMC